MPTVGRSNAHAAKDSLSRINELADQAAQELGLILLDLRLNRQGKQKVLEIAIFRKEPDISFADCEQMSRLLEKLFEAEEAKQPDFIADSYLLEVNSPGIERQLTKPLEFMVFSGKQVRIAAKKKIDSLGAEFIGTLAGGDESSVTIMQAYPHNSSTQKKTLGEKTDKVTVDLQDIYRIHLWTALNK